MNIVENEYQPRYDNIQGHRRVTRTVSVDDEGYFYAVTSDHSLLILIVNK